jgi:hypothetical protein
MRSLQRRVVFITEMAAYLIDELNELDQLRERIRNTQRSRAQPKQMNPIAFNSIKPRPGAGLKSPESTAGP